MNPFIVSNQLSWKNSKFSYHLTICNFMLLYKSCKCQVRINEVLATNTTFNYDKLYYNFPAWIELHNTGATTVNIGGYYLTDSKTNHTKWKIPTGASIGANSYLTDLVR